MLGFIQGLLLIIIEVSIYFFYAQTFSFLWYWKRKVSGACLGLEEAVRWPHCRTAQEDRLFL